MTDDGYATMNDFLIAARLFEGARPELAMVVLGWLFPFELDEQQMHQRVHLLVAVGAVLTGLATRRPAGDRGPDEAPEGALQVLTTQLIDAGARVDTRRIRDLIATHCGGTGVEDSLLTDVAVELLHRFVMLTRVGR